ncbi:MAG TPA: ATP-binding protein [Methylomirabilota bacterium]|nr:ATP-binding protein [Methylomirabilota bacterium]
MGSRLAFRSLRARLLGATVLLIALMMGAVTVVVEDHLSDAIVGEFARRGEVLARNLAAMSHGPLLLYNFTALEQNVAGVGGETDVVYAIVLDAEGRVAAHSRRPERVGTPLIGPIHESAARAAEPLTQETVTGDTREPIYDFAMPVYVGSQKWGTVRVGLSRRRMDAEILRTRLQLLALAGLTVLLGAGAAALLARRIAGPVQQLEAGAAAISRGELNQRIQPTTADEIGRLALAFNHMADQLFQQRAALEEVHGELKRQFEELADLKSYTDSILSSVTSGIVTVDLEGRVVTLNPAAELLTGYFAGEAMGRYCTEVFATTPELGEILMETLASRAPIVNVSLTLRRRTGAALPVEVSAAPLKGGDGKDLGGVGVFRDLTAVRNLETQLRRSDRLAALGTLAAGLAHEIKTPLTSVLTFTRHLVRRFDDEYFRGRFQSVVPRELERINRIVERLLELARPARLTFSLVRLPVLLDRVVELHAHELETRGAVVVREYARDVPPIQADEEALYQAFVNVVSNAVEAMGPGGRLTLRLGWHDGTELRAGRSRLFNRRVRIEVSDTGIGIAPSDAERVFNPFFTTRDGGTGLGLALTHKIVDDHSGTIDFQSRPGAGTTFRITLPVAAEPAAESEIDAGKR